MGTRYTHRADSYLSYCHLLFHFNLLMLTVFKNSAMILIEIFQEKAYIVVGKIFVEEMLVRKLPTKLGFDNATQPRSTSTIL